MRGQSPAVGETMKIKAPWTQEQVDALNAWQALGNVHPFTCGGKGCREDLVAHEAGWHCPRCSNRQDWAHDFMSEKR